MIINKLTYISIKTMNNDLLRVFETESGYDSAKPNFVYPTISYVKETDKLLYMEKISSTFKFYVDGTSGITFNPVGTADFEAEEGVTWREWINAEPRYNPFTCADNEEILIYSDDTIGSDYAPECVAFGTYQITYNGELVHADDVIMPTTYGVKVTLNE